MAFHINFLGVVVVVGCCGSRKQASLSRRLSVQPGHQLVWSILFLLILWLIRLKCSCSFFNSSRYWSMRATFSHIYARYCYALAICNIIFDWILSTGIGVPLCPSTLTVSVIEWQLWLDASTKRDHIPVLAALSDQTTVQRTGLTAQQG